jgi:hypothetical protein
VDTNTNAYRIVSSLTDENKKDTKRSRRASAAGKRGGPARAAVLSGERRKEISVKAISARWPSRAK